MEFNLSNRVKHQEMLNLFPEYPCLKHEIHTSQSSTLVSPQKNNPLLNDHLNPNFNYHILNVPNNHNMLKGPLSPNMNTAYIIKRKWTTREDMKLVKLVKQHGMQNWYQIARSMEGARDPKQCQERWLNHLHPNIKKNSWTLEEDMILIKCHWKVGNKWTEISKKLSGRSQNSVKNHWNSTKRRIGVKMNCSYNIINDNNDGSLLYEYIKMITLAEKVAKELKKSTSEMKVKMLLGEGSENLARLLLQ